MAAWAVQEASGERPSLSPYEYPDHEPCSVWVDVGPANDWMFSLGWFHTPALVHGRPHPMPAWAGKLVLIPGAGNGNALRNFPDFATWGQGGDIIDVAAPELDGLGKDEAPLKAWLERYTGTGWRSGEKTALAILSATLRQTP